MSSEWRVRRWRGAALAWGVVAYLAGCSAPPPESLQLAQVDLDLLRLEVPPGHQMRTAVTDAEGQVWFGSLDGGLARLDKVDQTFVLLTPDIARFGSEVEQLHLDPTTGDLILKLGYGQGRLVRYNPSQRTSRLIAPIRQMSQDHTRLESLDVRPLDRPWADDVVVMEDGAVWVLSDEAPPGIHADVEGGQPVFLPAPERRNAPQRLAYNGADRLWAVGSREASAYSVALREAMGSAKMPTQEMFGGPMRGALLGSSWRVSSAAAVGPDLWVATPHGVMRREGDRMVMFGERAHVPGSTAEVVARGGVVWFQHGDLLWQQLEPVARRSPAPKSMTPETLLPLPGLRLLHGGDGSEDVWVGSAQGVASLPGKSRERVMYRQRWVLPSAEPPEVKARLRRGWSGERDVMPQQLLETVNGLWLAGWGTPPAEYDAQSGEWRSLQVYTGSQDALVTTAATFDGLPVVLTRDTVRRWDASLKSFGEPVDVSGVLEEGERLEVALDQHRGVLVLGCPGGGALSVGDVSRCRKAAYLPQSHGQVLDLEGGKRACFQLIDDGVMGWETSRRQALAVCSADTLLAPLAPVELASGLQVAVRYMTPEQESFTPLTGVSPDLQVAWVAVGDQPAIWRFDGSVSPVRNAPKLGEGAKARAPSRFAMDVNGNLCHLHAQDGQSRAEVWCINPFGSTVARWEDARGALGGLSDARLRASPDGSLWIDGLRGRVAWLEPEVKSVHVLATESMGDEVPAGRRPLSRIMGFDRDSRAWVAGADVLQIPRRLDAAGHAERGRVISANRYWDRARWPMATMLTGGRMRFVLAEPARLAVLQFSPEAEAESVVQQHMGDDTSRDVGPNVEFIAPGNGARELWVGLSDGGVLHYMRGRPPQRYSRQEGLSTPEVLALAVLDRGAVVATPDGLYWIDPVEQRAQVIHAPEVAGHQVTALAAVLDGDERPGSAVFVGTSKGAVWRLTLPIDPAAAPVPGAERRAERAERAPQPVQALTPLALEQIATLSEGAQLTQLLALKASESTSGTDELVLGTSAGLEVMRSVTAAAVTSRPRPVKRGDRPPIQGEVTALARLPDGRVAAAYWDGSKSTVSLHDVATQEWWPIAHPDAGQRVHALAPMPTPTGDVYLVARQRGALAMSAMPLVTPTQVPPWVWLLAGTALLMAAAGALTLQRRNPVLMRLKVDPEGLRDVELIRVPGVDRAIHPHREMILTAAGVMEDRWALMVELGDRWQQSYGWPLGADDALLEVLCEVLGVELLEVLGRDAEERPVPLLCQVRLPRLPINLPTRKTLLMVLRREDMGKDFTQRDPRLLEDRLGAALRDQHQSMGTPFLLVTNLDDAPIPTLIHARYPGVVFRSSRLRDIALADLPRLSLSRAILMDAWLDAISPYKSSGPVDDPAMFMGRERVRRELLSSRSVSAIVCGGRRVGKTSLIRQLVRDLERERPEQRVYEISLLGIRSYADFVDRIERRLGITVRMSGEPEPGEPAGRGSGEGGEPPESLEGGELGDEAQEGGEERKRPSKTSALARLRRRRARRANPSLSPEIACAALREALEAHHIQTEQTPLLILDEIDGIAARDASNGYPLLSTLHQLKGEGICSFLLVGFAELYRQTYDYDSPLYNFARVLQLGGLDESSALRLITRPMARLGVTLESPEIAQRIVDETAGFPNLIQFICDMLLKRLSTHRRTGVTVADLEAIFDFNHPASQPLSSYLAESFDQNVDHREEVLVYTMLLYGPRPVSLSDIDSNLSRLGITTNLGERRSMVRRLKLVGILKELPGETFDLALPLLVRLLLAKDLKAAVAALVDEM